MLPQGPVPHPSGLAPAPVADGWDGILREAVGAFGAGAAFVSEVVDPVERRLRVVAVAGPRVPAWLRASESVEYPADRSPCGAALAHGFAFHAAGTRRTYAGHRESAADCEAYVGAALRGPTGVPVGVLAVVHDRPLDRDMQAAALLRPCAQRAEDALRRRRDAGAAQDSEDCYRVLAQFSPLGIWQIDVEGRTIYANPVMCAMLEIPGPEALAGRTHHDFFPPESLAVIGVEHEKRCRGLVSSYEVDLLGARGTRRRVVVHGGPVVDSQGRLRSLIGTFADVTEARRAEDERRRLEGRIQHGQKLESLGVLAGGIAHDFNNLLTGVLGNASLALMRLEADSPVRPLVERIEDAADRAASLTRQMLAYAGKWRSRFEPVDLSALVRDMEPLLRSSVSKKAALVLRCPDGMPPVHADLEQIRQVAMNLVTNGSDAIGDRGGTIAISIARVEKNEDEDAAPGAHVLLEVTDDGCGMDPLTQTKIFDPFFTTKDAGRGLGLSAVHGIVRAHGGTVHVQSHLDVGTRMRVYLPVAATQPSGASEEPRPEAANQGTVLVVDDEDVVLGVSRMALEDAGFRVLTARDGVEGVETVREHPEIDLVFLDMTMPRMNGEEALGEMRSHVPDLRVVLCSGYTEQEVAGPDLARQLAGFLQKPFRANDLLQKAREVLAS